jgi:hypothetical protein
MHEAKANLYLDFLNKPHFRGVTRWTSRRFVDIHVEMGWKEEKEKI